MALESSAGKREACSKLIADMYGRLVEPKFMEDAFLALLKQVGRVINSVVGVIEGDRG